MWLYKIELEPAPVPFRVSWQNFAFIVIVMFIVIFLQCEQALNILRQHNVNSNRWNIWKEWTNDMELNFIESIFICTILKVILVYKMKPSLSSYLRVSFEVSLVNRFVVARLRECGRGLASWERAGEVGGAWVGVRWSRSWPPWKVLRMVEPLINRERSEDVELEAPAPEMLWVDGDAGGNRCDKELRKETRKHGWKLNSPWTEVGCNSSGIAFAMDMNDTHWE